ncbi:von willebrand factor A [gamma proteobacterium BDW918]|uniref:VWFA domain-containing protein n=1 Tax=Zhongshania aliphaticivorans TaxID=1470434 RepID=A0A127M9M5_9GAMM|nr:von Willebrand factor type A domain-containing protein [Zhongshania aliphaticivorans]AMO69929.1 hypothetical protein AZF00_17195 [Zhongshania aliphaticivorans]EIF42059.1 von willebrand factor A [gamma proteobacterium BDW918]
MKYAASLSLLIIFAIAFIFLRGPQDSLLESQGTSEISAPNEFEHHAINELAEPQRNAVKDEAYTSAIGLAAPKPASEKMLAEHFAGAQAAAAHAKQIKESAMLVRQRSHFIADTDSSMSIAPRDREGYAAKTENRFLSVALSPLSTFGLEVDSASYANMRRQINNGQIPVPASVRLEELVNYFNYNFPAPTGKHPIAVMSDYAVAPWNPAHRIAMIGVKAVDTTASSERGARITFLLDTSGSMNSPNKLPLLIRSFQTLLSNLKQDDQVAIVTYAGSAGVVLPPTPVTESNRIQRALANLSARGSTAGGAGIALAYDVARKQFDSKATNLVILATDGDFNVGASSDGELKAMIEKQRASGVFLSVIGMGTGNYQDAKMQVLAEAGNGVAHYLDSDAEAQRLFGSELSRTLHIAAKDVKVQVEFSLVLSQSEHAGSASYAAALRRARAVLPLMPDDKRSEFIGLIERLTTTRIAQE